MNLRDWRSCSGWPWTTSPTVWLKSSWMGCVPEPWRTGIECKVPLTGSWVGEVVGRTADNRVRQTCPEDAYSCGQKSGKFSRWIEKGLEMLTGKSPKFYRGSRLAFGLFPHREVFQIHSAGSPYVESVPTSVKPGSSLAPPSRWQCPVNNARLLYWKTGIARAGGSLAHQSFWSRVHVLHDG